MIRIWHDLIHVLVNNTTNTFLIIPNIISYFVPFIKYLWISRTLLVSIGLKSTEKIFTLPINCKIY